MNRLSIQLLTVLALSVLGLLSTVGQTQLPNKTAPWLEELVDDPRYQNQINRFAFATGGALRLKLNQSLVEDIEMTTGQGLNTRRLLDYDQYLGGQYHTGE